jgi:DNA-binding CsgD family transcriptional regulator
MPTIDAAPLHRAEPTPRPAAQLLQQLLIDQIDCGLLVCGVHGLMLHANRAAQRELDDARFLKLKDKHVCCTGSGQDDFVAALHAAALQGRRRLLRLGEADPLMLVVTPLGTLPERGPQALVMIGRRTLCTPLGLELLAMQHRLTLAERRVLRALLEGEAARDIAAEHGVAVSTVRTQIQSIRDKLGVANIDMLLLTVARVPPVRSCH